MTRFLAKSSHIASAVYFEIDYNPDRPYQLQPSIPDNWNEILLVNRGIIAPALVLFAGILDRADVLTIAINHVYDDFLFEVVLFFTTTMFNLAVVQERLPKDEYYHFNVNNGKILKINMITMQTLVKKYKCSFNQIPTSCFDTIDFTNIGVSSSALVSTLDKLAFMPTINLAFADILINMYSKGFINKRNKVAKFSSISDIHTQPWLQRESLLVIAKKYFS